MTNEPLYIHPAETRRRFEEFARREINEVNLSEGALLVALEESPQLDLDGCLKTLDDLSERVAARMAMGEPAIFLLGHLHHELFDVEGFTGNTIDYDDVRNSYLNEVIASKRGLPITLSIIFMHVAQRVGLDVHGVGLPGHYIVRVQFPLSEVYVDPFYGGRTLTVREIDAMLAEMSGGEIRLRPHFLRRWTGRETLIRLLANLQNAHTRAGDKRKALSAEERIAILSRYAPQASDEPV